MKESNNKYYVYHLIDPKDNIPFYVGKGYGKRIYSHEKEVKNGILPNQNRYLFNSIKEILNGGMDIIYEKVKENLNEKDAFLIEMLEIKKYGRKNDGSGILTNMTDGGEGMSGLKHSNDSKKKISDAFKGKPTWSSLHKKEMSDKYSGKGNPFYGKIHSNNTKEKIGMSLKETFDKFGHPLKGKSKSLEHRKKISLRQKGKKISEKTKWKMSITRQNIYKIDDNIKNKILNLYNSGNGCKSITKILKKDGFPYSIAIVRRELKNYGVDLNKRNTIPIKVKIVSADGKIDVFDSCRCAENFLGCGRSNLSKILKIGGGIYKQYVIEKMK